MQPNVCREQTASRVCSLCPSVKLFESFETGFSSGKRIIPTLGNSANLGTPVLDSNKLHSSLNPLALPFVSKLCNEDCQNYYDSSSIGATPILDSILAPVSSLRSEILDRHSHECDSSVSEDVLGSGDTPIVFESETPNHDCFFKLI